MGEAIEPEDPSEGRFLPLPPVRLEEPAVASCAKEASRGRVLGTGPLGEAVASPSGSEPPSSEVPTFGGADAIAGNQMIQRGARPSKEGESLCVKVSSRSESPSKDHTDPHPNAESAGERLSPCGMCEEEGAPGVGLPPFSRSADSEFAQQLRSMRE